VAAPVVDPTLNDPSDPKVVAAPIAAVAPTEPLAAEPAPEPAPELPELRYEYQPKDTLGRPLGGKQVIKYHTPDELADKLRDQNIELVRKLREISSKHSDDIDVQLPNDAQRFTSMAEFAPRELSAEERFNLSQDLNDPSKSVEAMDTLLEARLGMKLDKVRDTLNGQQLIVLQLMAKSNYDTFEKNTPEFYPCAENRKVLTDWMFKKRLNPTVEMFNLAYQTLKGAGLLLDSPIVREVTSAPATPVSTVTPTAAPAVSTEPNPPQVPVANESRITPAEQPQAKRPVRVPSGLNSNVSSDASTFGVTATLTLEDIEKMPSDVYKKNLRNPAFAKLVNDLERQASTRRATHNVQ
jgi:hypothetical protein